MQASDWEFWMIGDNALSKAAMTLMHPHRDCQTAVGLCPLAVQKVELAAGTVTRYVMQHITSIKWPLLGFHQTLPPKKSAAGEEESFLSQVRCHTKCLLFLPSWNLSWGLLCLHHPSRLCKYTGILIENSQSVDSSLWSFCRAPMQYFPPPPQSGH